MAEDKPSLHYAVSLKAPASQRVAVTATLLGLDGRHHRLRWTLRRRFAFVRLPEPLLDGSVRATSEGAVLEVKRVGSYAWDVAVAEQTGVRLDYVVPLTHRTIDAVKRRDAYEYPYVADDHGLLVSPTLFLFPEGVDVQSIRVQFDLPETWQVIAPWRRVSENQFDPQDREALLNELIAIGAWHVHDIRIDGFEGTIAFAPGQDTLERAAVEPIRRIVEYELKLFGREPAGRYVFLFGRPEGSGLAGSPKTHSMTLSVEPRLAPMAGRHLPHLVAHEFYHTWAAALFDMPAELRWLNEGFTDYYAYLVAARLGLSTWEEFAATLAEKMRSCAENPLRGELSLTQAGDDVFFSDHHAYNLVYDAGLLIGAWLDRAIRSQGRGETLDDLMRTFINDPRWSRETAPTPRDFFVATQRFVDEATATRLTRLVNRPYAFDPVAAFAEVGIEVRHEIGPPEMDLRANLDGTRVVDLDRNGLAHRVGVRAHDRLVEVNGQAVAGPGDVHRAWRKPVDGRIRLTLERDGQKVAMDQAVPLVNKFAVATKPWREHQ